MNRRQRRALASLKRRGLTKGLTLQTRTEEDIKRDYANACAQLGELRYHRSQLDAAETTLVNTIAELNNEAKALKAAQPAPEAPKAEEAVSAVPQA